MKESIGSPERIAAAIGYYRALYDPSGADPDLADEQAATLSPVPRPTLYLHGVDDGCFSVEAAGRPLDYLAEGSAMVTSPGPATSSIWSSPRSSTATCSKFLAR